MESDRNYFDLLRKPTKLFAEIKLKSYLGKLNFDLIMKYFF